MAPVKHRFRHASSVWGAHWIVRCSSGARPADGSIVHCMTPFASPLELWAMRIPEIGTVVAQAERAEALGWDGITFTDSQNLIGDPFVAVALAANATDR